MNGSTWPLPALLKSLTRDKLPSLDCVTPERRHHQLLEYPDDGSQLKPALFLALTEWKERPRAENRLRQGNINSFREDLKGRIQDPNYSLDLQASELYRSLSTQ